MIKIWKSERFKKIMELISVQNVVSIEDLCKVLNVSKATIRRDITELDKVGKLTKTHGGAVSFEFGTSKEPPFLLKKDYNVQEKIRIAEAAYKSIKPGETIILDSSTTILELANHLVNAKNLMIVTNDLLIATKLASNTALDVLVIGGELRKQYYTMIGLFSQMVLKEIHADKVFLGVDGVDLESGFMLYNIEESQVKKLMIESAKELIVLCDHTKFSNIALVNICPLERAKKIITGSEIDKKIVEKLKNLNINVEIV